MYAASSKYSLTSDNVLTAILYRHSSTGEGCLEWLTPGTVGVIGGGFITSKSTGNALTTHTIKVLPRSTIYKLSSQRGLSAKLR